MESSSIDTSQLTPDVGIALELLRLADMEGWGDSTAGLFHPIPWIYIEDAERLAAVQAWLSTRATDEPSYVQAAVANFKRVIEDLLLVLHHHMEVRGSQYWVVKWYHLTHGRPGHQRDVDEYRAHVALIWNLGAELTRALNLILDRVRTANSAAVGSMGTAVIAAGPEHRLVESPAYSSAEADVPQPYPGLRAFPRTLPNRADGSFGVGRASDAPTVPEIERWISVLELAHGAGNGPPPVTDQPPFSLERSIAEPKDAGPVDVPLPVFLGIGALSTVSSVIAIANEASWVIGAVMSAVTCFVLLRHHAWAPNVRPWAWAVIALMAVCGGLAGRFVSTALEGNGSTQRPSTQSVERNASRSLTGGAGQLEGGDILRARPVGTKLYGDPTAMSPGGAAEAKVRLSNVGPDALIGIRLRARVSNLADTAASVEVTASSSNANPPQTSDTVALQFGAETACVRLVSDSVRLLDAHSAPLRSLPNSLEGTGVTFGTLDVGHGKKRFVSFLVRAVRPGPDGLCRAP